MKIALLVAGELRCLDLAYNYWPHLNLPNIDTYFSVWKQIEYGDIQYHGTVDYELMQKFNPVSIIIEDKDKVELEMTNGNSNAKKQFHRIVMGLNAIFASKVAYDLVVITRSDLFFGCSQQDLAVEFRRSIDNYAIGLLGPSVNTFTEDIFMILPFSIATQIAQIDFVDLLTNKYTVPAPQHPLLGDIFKIYKIQSVSETVWQNIEVIRPNCRDSEELTIGLVRQKFYEWGNVLRCGIISEDEEYRQQLLKLGSNSSSK
jgi:hypothetical protein